MPQIDDQGGQPQHRERCAAADQIDGDELRGAGKNDDRHQYRGNGGEAGGDGQCAENDGKWRCSNDQGDDVTGTSEGYAGFAGHEPRIADNRGDHAIERGGRVGKRSNKLFVHLFPNSPRVDGFRFPAQKVCSFRFFSLECR